MAIARSTLALLGTDESTGSTVANNATGSGSEVDVLGDNASTGTLDLYLVFTSTVTAGSLDVTYSPRRVTGQAYTARQPQWSVTPANATKKYFLGTVRATRYAQVAVLNNATGASATNVAVLAELTKVT